MSAPSKKWFVWVLGEADRPVKVAAPSEEAAKRRIAERRNWDPKEVYAQEAKPLEKQTCPECGWTFMGRGYGGAEGNQRRCTVCKAKGRVRLRTRDLYRAQEALRVALLQRKAQAERRKEAEARTSGE